MTQTTHPETEQYRWTIVIPDHPRRAETPTYEANRALMIKIVETVDDWTFGGGPYQDHHGGAMWVHDGDGWLCLGLPLGIEWSAQFCADPAKIDKLRQQARRIIAALPRHHRQVRGARLRERPGSAGHRDHER